MKQNTAEIIHVLRNSCAPNLALKILQISYNYNYPIPPPIYLQLSFLTLHSLKFKKLRINRAGRRRLRKPGEGITLSPASEESSLKIHNGFWGFSPNNPLISINKPLFLGGWQRYRLKNCDYVTSKQFRVDSNDHHVLIQIFRKSSVISHTTWLSFPMILLFFINISTFDA